MACRRRSLKVRRNLRFSITGVPGKKCAPCFRGYKWCFRSLLSYSCLFSFFFLFCPTAVRELKAQTIGHGPCARESTGKHGNAHGRRQRRCRLLPEGEKIELLARCYGERKKQGGRPSRRTISSRADVAASCCVTRAR